MTFPDIIPDLKARMPELRGRLLANQPLAELTWFRVGGPAQVLFMPEDENDLAYFLMNLPGEIPVILLKPTSSASLGRSLSLLASGLFSSRFLKVCARQPFLPLQ